MAVMPKTTFTRLCRWKLFSLQHFCISPAGIKKVLHRCVCVCCYKVTKLKTILEVQFKQYINKFGGLTHGKNLHSG